MNPVFTLVLAWVGRLIEVLYNSLVLRVDISGRPQVPMLQLRLSNTVILVSQSILRKSIPPGGGLSVASTRHWVTCSSNPGVGGIFFPYFGPFSVTSYLL